MVDIRVGAALDTLPTLLGGEPYDFVFIDADKPNNTRYLQWALKLTRPASVMDNVIWEGTILDPGTDPDAGFIRDSLVFMGVAGCRRDPNRGLQGLGRLRDRRGAVTLD